MTGEAFSSKTRAENLDRISRGVWDVVVIGGGITGAGVARDAALRGLRTVLVERGDFAGGTSSRSGRMIHGGLRYLEQAQFRMVAEGLAERAVLHRIAPHLVRPQMFIAPVYGSPLARVRMAAGLALYQALAFGRAIGSARLLSLSQTCALEPLVAPDGLVGGAVYYDCLADDTRLVLTLVRDAHRRGAVPANYAAAVDLLTHNGRIAGVAVRDALTGRSHEVRSRVVINATGPWLDLPGMRTRPSVPPLRRTRGSHIVVPRSRLGLRHAVIFAAPDRRYLYAVPWRWTVILGTTEAEHGDDLEDLYATADEVGYVLEATNRTFPSAALEERDIISTFAGVRPLVDRPGMTTHRVPRDYQVVEGPPGLVSVAGGKLTTFRRMAEEAVDAAVRSVRLGARRSLTASTLLEPDEQPLPVELDGEQRRYLFATYGGWLSDALASAAGALAEPLISGFPYLRAQVVHAVKHEMAITLCDCLIRRLHVIHEVPDQGLGVAGEVARLIAPYLGWTETEVQSQMTSYRAAVALSRRYRSDSTTNA